MNSRLQQFLKAENISQAQFADTIGVARANVSHIIAGRNKPGFDFLLRLSKHYPSLNLEWIITGKGRMFNTKGLLFEDETPAAAVQQPQPRLQQPKAQPQADNSDLFQSSSELNIPIPDTKVEQISDSRTISKIIVFYSDGSYQELK